MIYYGYREIGRYIGASCEFEKNGPEFLKKINSADLAVWLACGMFGKTMRR